MSDAYAALPTELITWFKRQGRDLPWRDTRDPYRIWVAEIILQQTRIQQGIQYFYRFVERFPDIYALAQAEQDEVLKYWEGLGYYSRARNLHAAAQQIVGRFNGEFPKELKQLLELKGVGPYTARAIASFAFDSPVGVLDGNVIRVVSRLLGDARAVNQPKVRRDLQRAVDGWAAQVDSRSFNHAMMDLGAMVCTPTRPACMICPLVEMCVARARGQAEKLPNKGKALKRRRRYFQFFLLRDEMGRIAVRQRPEDGFWGGLWEIPNLEVQPQNGKVPTTRENFSYQFSFRHVFTHFDMEITVFDGLAGDAPETLKPFRFIGVEEIVNFAFARAVTKIFEKSQLARRAPRS